MSGKPTLFPVGYPAPPIITGVPSMDMNETFRNPLVNFYRDNPELQTVFPTRQPDIEWVPEYSKYLARQEKRRATENLQTQVPFGWPERVDGPEVWDGSKFKTENGGLGDATWVVHFKPSHIRDLERALAYYRVREYIAFESTALSGNRQVTRDRRRFASRPCQS